MRVMGSWHRVGVRLLGLWVVWFVGGESRALAAPGFALYAGAFDIGDAESVVEVGFDYRFRPLRMGLAPEAGLGLTGDEAVFVQGGFRYDISLSRKWTLAPSLALSFYEEGDGQVLGSLVEFRSGLALDYRLSGGARVGLGIYHMSNAGLSSTNPGVNSLLLHYQLRARAHD